MVDEEIGIKESVSVKNNRGLRTADKVTRKRVASAGANAPHVKRGLEAASYETKLKVARLGGKVRSSDKQGMSEAGKIGGSRVLQINGRQFYQKIGSRGGKITRRRHGREHYRKIGMKGGAIAKEMHAGTDYYRNISVMRKKKKKK